MVKLVEELMYSSERPPGYPDSDDELDDDDEGDEGAEGRKSETLSFCCVSSSHTVQYRSNQRRRIARAEIIDVLLFNGNDNN